MTDNPTPATGPAARESDLASRWVGGTVVAASDESFGEKEHLLDPGPCNPQPGRYGPRGELVDGWETRRRRGGPGEDWAIVRLGVQGVVTAVDVDTTSFTGNHPVTCRIEATGCEGYPGPAALLGRTVRWETLVPDRELGGDAHHLLPVVDERCWTHVRLVIAPDGGVARLRVYGRVLADPRKFDGVSVDLASWRTGGLVVASSDDPPACTDAPIRDQVLSCHETRRIAGQEQCGLRDIFHRGRHTVAVATLPRRNQWRPRHIPGDHPLRPVACP